MTIESGVSSQTFCHLYLLFSFFLFYYMQLNLHVFFIMLYMKSHFGRLIESSKNEWIVHMYPMFISFSCVTYEAALLEDSFSLQKAAKLLVDYTSYC